ncbi:hypothetical protein [Marinoscillum sp.]|uniref:hypothetical protein n=1 Tax=Marinoscillum sp. TaxID=2024838 RepID=UPI003BAA9C96
MNIRNTFVFWSVSMVIAISSCADESLQPEEQCSTHAVIEDWSGLDGCGYLLKLDNGEYLEPIIVGYCGTPPISEEQMNDPLANFSMEDGMEVLIDYDVASEYGSICMKGTTVKITCIQEVGSTTETDL